MNRSEELEMCLFKQKTAYEERISYWSSDFCSSDLSREAGIDPDRAVLHRDDAVRDAKAEDVMRMNTALCLGLQDAVVSRKPRGILIPRHRAAAVDDVDAVRAIAFKEPRLLRQRIGRRHSAHQQAARANHTHATRKRHG